MSTPPRRGLRTDLSVGERLTLDVFTPGGVQRVEITVEPMSRTHAKMRIVAGDAVKISKDAIDDLRRPG